MAKKPGKNIVKARLLVEARPYKLTEASETIKKAHFVKFDETVELVINLGIDPKHSDQMVRGTVVLPHGLGKSKRVLVIATGEKVREAQEAGADFVGGEDMVQKIQEGWTDFDAVIATPDMMRSAGRLGKVLGPRGLMPNPKVGTVTMDVTSAIKDAKGGAVEYRVEKAGIVQAGVGKASFEENALVENVRSFVDSVAKAKPQGAKGTYMKKISISSTMGPGVKIALGSVGVQVVV
jgi:large subunit ribosomal protein L1